MLQISSAFGLILSTTNSYAIDCTPTPDCATLGYTKTASDCSGVAAIKCPFDTSKVFCEKEQLTKTCDKIGDILYGDGTCAVSADNLDPNLTPIGIVFDVSGRLAIALTDVKKDGTAGSEKMSWSSGYCDTPNLDNCNNTNTVITSCGLNGRSNTDAILATNGGCGGTTTAALAVNTYSINGCNKDFCKQGKWFLPSMKELYTIYVNKTTMTNVLTKLGSKASKFMDDYYWSSTECTNYSPWELSMGGGSRDYHRGKTTGDYVRPVVKY